MTVNGDGMLTPDEVPEFLARMLTGADLNADGAIDRAELGQAMQIDARSPGWTWWTWVVAVAASNPEEMTKQLMAGDRNGDGMLSPDEVSPQALGMLRDADTNGDGHLNAKEVRQAMETARQRMQQFRGGRGGQQGGDFNPQDRANRRPQE